MTSLNNPQKHVLSSTMRQAFERLPMSALVDVVGNQVVRRLRAGTGQFRPKRMWNASLSYATAQKLKRQGVLPE